MLLLAHSDAFKVKCPAEHKPGNVDFENKSFIAFEDNMPPTLNLIEKQKQK